MKTMKCPVCRKSYLISGLKLHIINTAKSEVYTWYSDNSMRKPHQDYIEKKVKLVKEKEWSF